MKVLWLESGYQIIYKSSSQRTLERENVAKQLFGLLLFEMYCPINLAEVYLLHDNVP
jgi:hypothetical protein